ncbi:MAG: DUF2461 domain-containing protein [Bacteroidales bacterium]|nr:DUF2461 domain-containing protein [Bacteroidales bacterium]
MISKNIVGFLKELRLNNNREWFQNNKSKYDKAKNEFEDFVRNFIPVMMEIDNEIGYLEPKDCIFRIFRDVRFSKDKSPYKTNFGVFFVKGGRKSGYGGYYLHIEPGNYFIGGGIHMPPNIILKAIRTEIYENIDEFKSIINEPELRTYYGYIDADRLKSFPRDFPKDFPDIDLLKFTSYTIGRQIEEEEILSKDFVLELKQAFIIMKPFIRFLNRAVN